MVLSFVLGLGVLAASLVIPGSGFAGQQAVSGDGTFPIAGLPGEDATAPALAHDPGRHQFLVAYENNGTTSAVCLNGRGETLRAFSLGNGTAPDVAYNSGHDQYLVVYQATSALVEGAYISGSCCQGCSTGPFVISSDRPFAERSPTVAYNSDSNHQDYLVVWEDGFDGNPSQWGIWGRLVTQAGVSGNSFVISVDFTNQVVYSQPDVAYNSNANEYLVVYTRDASSASGDDIYGRRVSATGIRAPQEHAFDGTENDQEDPAVAAYPLNTAIPYLVVYTDFFDDEQGDVRGVSVDKNGIPSSFVGIATESGFEERAPDITSDEGLGGYSVVWSQGDSTPEIYERWLGGSGATGLAFQVTGSAAGGDNAAVAGGSPVPLAAWQTNSGADWDVYGRFLPYRSLFLPLVKEGN
jgi:hypothetical protein